MISLLVFAKSQHSLVNCDQERSIPDEPDTMELKKILKFTLHTQHFVMKNEASLRNQMQQSLKVLKFPKASVKKSSKISFPGSKYFSLHT